MFARARLHRRALAITAKRNAQMPVETEDPMVAMYRAALADDGQLPPPHAAMIRILAGFLQEVCRTDRDWRLNVETACDVAERFVELAAGPRRT